MAKSVKKKETHLDYPAIPKNAILVLDRERKPVIGLFNRSVAIKFEKEYLLILGMKVDQSAVFNRSKLNIIGAIRTYIQKTTKQKYLVRKINADIHRIWRIADNSKTRAGGRIKGKKYPPKVEGETKQ